MLHAAHCAYAGLRCDTLPLLSASTCTGVCTCKLLLPPACCLIVFFFVTAGCAANLPSGFSICWLSLYQTQFANSRISQEKNHLSPVSQWKKAHLLFFACSTTQKVCAAQFGMGFGGLILPGQWQHNFYYLWIFNLRGWKIKTMKVENVSHVNETEGWGYSDLGGLLWDWGGKHPIRRLPTGATWSLRDSSNLHVVSRACSATLWRGSLHI